jgi:hypothetical protein
MFIKLVVNQLQKVLTYIICQQMDEKPHWLSFTTLECAWEFDVEISCKEVAYSCMWVALYIRYCIQHRVSTTIATTCPLAFKAI